MATSQDQVTRLTALEAARTYQGVILGQLILGDFNHAAWEDMYNKWVAQLGLILPSDPMKKTFRSGHSLDKVSYLPGYVMPPNILPPEPEYEWRKDRGEVLDQNYAAVTLGREEVGNHHPVYLELSVGDEEMNHTGRIFRLDGITEKQRRAEDQKLVSLPQEEQVEMDQAQKRGDTTRMYIILIAAQEEALRTNYKKRIPYSRH